MQSLSLGNSTMKLKKQTAQQPAPTVMTNNIKSPTQTPTPTNADSPSLHTLITQSSNLSNNYFNEYEENEAIIQQYDAIINNNYDMIIQRLTAHPEEASVLDENGRPPLSLLCAVSDVPFLVIKKIIEVYPTATTITDKNGSYPIHFYIATGSNNRRPADDIDTKKLKDIDILKLLIQHSPNALTTKNKFGNTPLQVAMETEMLDDESRSEILKILVSVGSTASYIRNESGSFPLHFSWRDPTPDRYITRKLLEYHPNAADMTNAYGATPLFMAINWDAPIDILEVLLDACPHAVKIKDKRGICSISSAWNLFVHEVRVKDTDNAAKEKERVKNNRRALKMAATHLDLIGDAEKWWNKIQLLLKAAYHNSVHDPLPDNKKWRVLHAAAGCDCPPELLRLVLKLCRVQLFIKDEDNKLPLHIAASAPLYVKQPFESQSEPVITKLASAFPDGVLEVDNDGRLALHIALEHRKTWEDGINHLVSLHPQTARVCDPKTRLYPFMLAAIEEQSHDKTSPRLNKEEATRIAKASFKSIIWKRFHTSRKEVEINKVIQKADANKTNTVYQLLRLAPDLIKFTNSDVVDKLKEKEKLYLKLSNKTLEEEYIEMLNDADTLKDLLDQRRAKSWTEISHLEERLNALRDEERQLTNRWKKTNSNTSLGSSQMYQSIVGGDDFGDGNGHDTVSDYRNEGRDDDTDEDNTMYEF